jgi:Protein of unknown function (DUF4239)
VNRWLVIHIPSWWLLMALVVGIIGAALALRAFLRRRFPKLGEGEQNDVLIFGFAVVGGVYAIITGFIIILLWGEVSHAADLAQTEGAHAVQMARDTARFDEPVRERLRQDLLAYQQAALAEFEEVSKGGHTFTAEAALARLRASYAAIQPRDDNQRAALTDSLESLKQTSLARTQRVLIAEEDVGPPLAVWTVIFLTSGLVVGFAVFFGESRAQLHIPIIVAVCVLVATNLFLITELAFPYLGFGVGPGSLQAVDDVLREY